MFGRFKIVPSANLEQLGRQQGEAAGFDWKWYYSAAGWLIWAALVLAFIVPNVNHNIRILLVLVPLLIVNLLWRFFMDSENLNRCKQIDPEAGRLFRIWSDNWINFLNENKLNNEKFFRMEGIFSDEIKGVKRPATHLRQLLSEKCFSEWGNQKRGRPIPSGEPERQSKTHSQTAF